MGKVKQPSLSVCQTLTFGLAKSPPLAVHCNHKIGRENSGLMAANVKLSDDAQTTNSSWFLLEQDPHGHGFLNFLNFSIPMGDSTADRVLHHRIFAYTGSDPFSRRTGVFQPSPLLPRALQSSTATRTSGSCFASAFICLPSVFLPFPWLSPRIFNTSSGNI